jgi:hypothetical protein
LRVVEFLRADPVARENFLRLAGAVVWKRIVREIERE